jgi:hypothetical protein
MQLDLAEQSFLLSRLCETLPLSLSSYLHQLFIPSEKKLSIIEWRQSILESLIRNGQTQLLQQSALTDRIDGFLYQNLPVVSGKQWKALARRILSDAMTDKVENALLRFPDTSSPFMLASDVKDAIKACFLASQGKITLPFDLDSYVAMHACFVGIAPPTPLLFADTNWTHHFFGFVVNPGNGDLELWRLDRTLSQGMPMSQWKHWLNGRDRKPWTIFTRPMEYQMSPRDDLGR